MKDIREDITTELADDPVKLAQKLMAPQLKKRFYKKAAMAQVDGLYQLQLDGRNARTPAKKFLAVNDAEFAQEMAAEWEAQEEEINPAKMPFTRLANSAIDGVATTIDEVHEEVAKFAGSDLLFYRAASPQELVAKQSDAWDPILDYFKTQHGAEFVLTEGLVHMPQPVESVAIISKIVGKFDDNHMALAGLQVLTSISGSVLLALATSLNIIEREQAWLASHVDEDWNISQWGEDDEAQQRRAYRKEEFCTALMAARTVSYQ